MTLRPLASDHLDNAGNTFVVRKVMPNVGLAPSRSCGYGMPLVGSGDDEPGAPLPCI